MNQSVSLEEVEALIEKAKAAEKLHMKNNSLEVELKSLQQQRMALEEQKRQREQSREEVVSRGSR